MPTARCLEIMPKPEISISKKVLPSLPNEYRKTVLGDPMGADNQYRGPSGVHVREYKDSFVVHVDEVDPRFDVLGHLVQDTPETLAAFGAGLILSKLGFHPRSEKSSHKCSKIEAAKERMDKNENRVCDRNRFGATSMSLIFSIFLFDRMFRRIKRLLLGF